ncbi:GDSL-type esterase/lipase family protein [Psychrobacillus sp. NPDC058041]|uniref:GDSL-type esterase/lipase family protein n=1 Tax=Psychrobacillus sp. NPDC058041 TaxID=3346310 RepID=UPI0036DADC64
MKYIFYLLCIILLGGCDNHDTFTLDFTEKESISFEEYVIPYSFFPRTLQMVGIGDSLTKGVGDELKKEGYIGRVKRDFLQFNGIEDVVLTNTALRGRRSDQLLKLLKNGDFDYAIRNADIMMITIGGNDLMKIVKKDLFNLKVESFEKGLVSFENNYMKIIDKIRKINSNGKIVLIGLYNPVSVVTEESSEFDAIINDWNKTIENIAKNDGNACFVPIEKLFDTNKDLVYHTDFFHPNSKGYQLMEETIIRSLVECGFIDEENRELLF